MGRIVELIGQIEDGGAQILEDYLSETFSLEITLSRYEMFDGEIRQAGAMTPLGLVEALLFVGVGRRVGIQLDIATDLMARVLPGWEQRNPNRRDPRQVLDVARLARTDAADDVVDQHATRALRGNWAAPSLAIDLAMLRVMDRLLLLVADLRPSLSARGNRHGRYVLRDNPARMVLRVAEDLTQMDEALDWVGVLRVVGDHMERRLAG